MTAKEALKVGIVGCGEVTQRWHIPSLLKIRNVEIAAVCDTNEELVKGIAKKFNISGYHADFSEMLEKEELNMVDICTSPGSHAALSIQAMEAGCHVLVEKPMTLSLKQADEMVSASKRNQVKLCVVHNELLLPVVLKARSMVSQGVIGELSGIDIKDSWPKDGYGIPDRDHWFHKLPGGVFGEMLPHPIYIAQAFVGNMETIAVYARKLSSYDWVAADELRVILKGERGLATLTESLNWGRDTMMLDIFGTRMNLHVDVWGSTIVTYAPAGYNRSSRGMWDLRQGVQQLTGTMSTALKVILGRHRNGHLTLIRRFAESIQNDTESPVMAEEAREVVRVFEEITGQIGSNVEQG